MKSRNMLPLGSVDKKENKADSSIRLGRSLASFGFPFVGAYTYLSLKDKKPEKAKKYGMLSVAGLGLWILGAVVAKMRNI